MNIAVAGTGYVGLSIATSLAQHKHVTAIDSIIANRYDTMLDDVQNKVYTRDIFKRD